MTQGSDSRLLLLSEQDNVVIARTNFTRGDVVTIDGVQVTLSDGVHLGFKIARGDVSAGQKIFKYGAIIGSATADIRRGDVVHLHNMRSDYLPTYSHEAGVAFTKRTV
ncbi:MAG: UxaA family hydrolase [Steroidobacteraceae bacterium]